MSPLARIVIHISSDLLTGPSCDSLIPRIESLTTFLESTFLISLDSCDWRAHMGMSTVNPRKHVRLPCFGVRSFSCTHLCLFMPPFPKPFPPSPCFSFPPPMTPLPPRTGRGRRFWLAEGEELGAGVSRTGPRGFTPTDGKNRPRFIDIMAIFCKAQLWVYVVKGRRRSVR